MSITRLNKLPVPLSGCRKLNWTHEVNICLKEGFDMRRLKYIVTVLQNAVDSMLRMTEFIESLLAYIISYSWNLT